MTRTLGIDLASQPAGTATCVVEWAPASATVTELRSGLDDDALVELMSDAAISRVGIDAPFGWPDAFVAAVQTWGEGKPWIALQYHQRNDLRFRQTDLEVVRSGLGLTPLSVSTDKISITAMRCAALLTRTGETVDRSGHGRFVEVYPAAALRAWGFSSRGYKGSKPAQLLKRERLFAAVRTRTPWLVVSPPQAEVLRRSDHALDALVAAIVAWLAFNGHVALPPHDELGRARREGWIAIPNEGSLELLPRAS